MVDRVFRVTQVFRIINFPFNEILIKCGLCKQQKYSTKLRCVYIKLKKNSILHLCAKKTATKLYIYAENGTQIRKK